jgi:outer membrane protein OmpA-like peptidoglycan-associated protein
LGPGASCWCCEEAHAERDEAGAGLGPLFQFLIAGLVALVALALIIMPIYCSLTGACNWFGETPPKFEPAIPPPVQTAPSQTTTPTQPPGTASPTITPPTSTAPSPTAPTSQSAYPGLTQQQQTPNIPPASSAVEASRPPPVFHVAFFETKANLTPEAMNALASAASQVLQMNRTARLRVEALGARETNGDLWRRRLNAVKDELVRLGVPANQIRHQGAGPYMVTIGASAPRPSAMRRRIRHDLDIVPDPMSGGEL